MRNIFSKALVALSLLLCLTTAFADNVLVIDANYLTVTANVVGRLQAAGKTVTVVTSPPTSTAGYQEVWDLRYSAALTSAEITMYTSFITNGGFAYFVTENPGCCMARNNSVAALVTGLGGGSTQIGPGWANNTENTENPTYMTSGLTVNYLAVASIVNSNGIPLIEDSNGNVSAMSWIGRAGDLGTGVTGTVVTVADVNWLAQAWGAQNQQELDDIILGVDAGTVAGTISSSGNGAGAQNGNTGTPSTFDHTNTGETVTTNTMSTGTFTGGGGTLQVNSGALTVTNPITLTTGMTIDENGLNSTFSGVISGPGGLVITGTDGSVTLTAQNTYTGATGITSGATLINNGSIASSSGVLNNGTFINNGNAPEILNNGTATNSSTGTTGDITNSGTFTNAGTVGAVTNNSNATFTNTGTIGVVANNGTFNNNTGGTTGDVANTGTFINNGTVGNVNDNTGTFNNSGTASAVTNHNTFNNSGTTGSVTNAGTFTNTGTTGDVTNNSTFNNYGNSGNVTNTNVVDNAVGGIFATLTTSGIATNEGTITGLTTVSAGAFTNSGTTGDVNNSGAFSNSGVVNNVTNTGTFVNTGTLTSINNSGTFDITGAGNNLGLTTYTQTSAGTTLMLGSQHITVSGVATLDGSLAILNPPTAIGKYDYITAGSISGRYASLTANNNDRLSYSGTDVYLLVMPSNADVQTGVNAVASSLSNMNSLASGAFNNALGSDCSQFGESGGCVSVNYGKTTAASGNLNSDGIVIAKSINPNFRIGVYSSNQINSSSVSGINFNSKPTLGGFIGWNKNTDGTGLGVSVSTIQGNGNYTIGSNAPTVAGQANQIKATYTFTPSDKVTVTPYSGIRRTSLTVGGYTDAGIFPMTYSEVKQSTTDLLAGVTVGKQLTEKLSGSVSVGVVKNLSYNAGNVNVTGDVGTFTAPLPGDKYTSTAASAGLSYEVAKNKRIGFSIGFQQRGLTNTNISSIGISYTISW